MSFNIPKGTKDVLPEDSYKWHFIEDAVRETTRLFDVKEIRTPTFEHTELFLRGVGDTTDIVNKEMYTFFDKGNRSITLKPEGTAMFEMGSEQTRPMAEFAAALPFLSEAMILSDCFGVPRFLFVKRSAQEMRMR